MLKIFDDDENDDDESQKMNDDVGEEDLDLEEEKFMKKLSKMKSIKISLNIYECLKSFKEIYGW